MTMLDIFNRLEWGFRFDHESEYNSRPQLAGISRWQFNESEKIVCKFMNMLIVAQLIQCHAEAIL